VDGEPRDALRLELSWSAEPALQSLVEAILFASPQPVTLHQLMRAVRAPEQVVRQALERIRADQDRPERGVFLRETRGGYQLGTRPELDGTLREALRGVRPRPPLSRPALETPSPSSPISSQSPLQISKRSAASKVPVCWRRCSNAS
jgi:hypothetical protein